MKAHYKISHNNELLNIKELISNSQLVWICNQCAFCWETQQVAYEHSAIHHNGGAIMSQADREAFENHRQSIFKTMSLKEFIEFSDQFFKDCQHIMVTKGKEYANNLDDKFANFNRIADRTGISNLQVAHIYLTKHLDAIEFYIKNGESGSEELISGRFKDAINYLTLMAGMAVCNERTKK